MKDANKNPAAGGLPGFENTIVVSEDRQQDDSAAIYAAQYTPDVACAFLLSVRDWHRDRGLIHAATLVDARRSALFYAFAEAAVHRFMSADRIDRLYVPAVIVGHTRHARAARIHAADAREIAAHADAIAAQFVDSLQA